MVTEVARLSDVAGVRAFGLCRGSQILGAWRSAGLSGFRGSGSGL